MHLHLSAYTLTLARNLPQWAILPHHGRAMVECACMEWWWLLVASPADSDQVEGRSWLITLPIFSSKYSCNIPTRFIYMYIHIHCTCTWTHNYAVTFSWTSIISLPLGSVFPKKLGTAPYNPVSYVFRYMHVSILSWCTCTHTSHWTQPEMLLYKFAVRSPQTSIPHIHTAECSDGVELIFSCHKDTSSQHMWKTWNSHQLNIPMHTTGHWIEWTAMASTVHHSIATARGMLLATASNLKLHRRLHTSTHLLRLLRHW